MKVVILQSNYIPWRGYFDMMNLADVFVIYDEVQYTKNDWRNRNKIKTPNGLNWLTIPVKQLELAQKICDTETQQIDWQRKHWNAIQMNYAKSPFFKLFKELFESFYKTNTNTNLSYINYELFKIINSILNINTKIIYSNTLDVVSGKNEKLVNICEKLNATTYISGPAAKNYLDTNLFTQKNINVHWMDYTDYKPYNQLHGEFEPQVSIIDLIFNEGPNAKHYLKSFL